MDDDIEAAWERERHREEVMAARDRCLADADQARAELAERIERNRQAERSDLSAPAQPVTRAVAPRERPQPQPDQSRKEWSDSWNAWAFQAIDAHVGAAAKAWVGKQLEAFAEGIGEETGKWFDAERAKTRAELKAAIDELRSEIAAAEERVRTSLSAEIRIAALEARLEAAERRAAPTPIRPRLVDGGGDAA